MSSKRTIVLSQNFASGGGDVAVVQSDPVVIRVRPHREGPSGWSRMWWYFQGEGFTPGETVTLKLTGDGSKLEGISPRIFFSYDQQVWGLTDAGTHGEGEEAAFIYRHKVRERRVWFAYDLPYTPDHFNTLLVPLAERNSDAEVFELCRTRKDRPVRGLRFRPANSSADTYGVWLQARAHAFESGASWVLHELARWLLSSDSAASTLRSVAEITVVPVVDVDGVEEGRTGKYQQPYDHWMNWQEEDHHWPEVRATKAMLRMMAKENRVDAFIDFHGPGGSSHPYFILPEPQSLPHTKQRENRDRFFEVLEARELDEESKKTQSMTHIHYSPRPMNTGRPNSSEWVSLFSTDHNVAMTIEVNMNTPLSTRDGYRAEAVVLGRALSRYFGDKKHKR